MFSSLKKEAEIGCRKSGVLSLTELSFRTCKCRVYKLEKALTILSASNKDAGLIFEGELRALSVEKKEQLLAIRIP
ncbi:hypothetical protein EMCRGX_G001281 [Ephydatia muelleri]